MLLLQTIIHKPRFIVQSKLGQNIYIQYARSMNFIMFKVYRINTFFMQKKKKKVIIKKHK
jgi:hypothetical protein